VAGGDPVYYWDTCLFLAWIKDEERPTGEMDGVREVIQRFKRREVKIVTSTLTQVEVLQSRLPVGIGHLFLDLMKRIQRWHRSPMTFAITTWFARQSMAAKHFPRQMPSTLLRPFCTVLMNSIRLTTMATANR